MAKNKWSEFGRSLEEHGSPRVASDPIYHDLFAKKLTSTAPSTPSAVTDKGRDSWQNNRDSDTENTDWEESIVEEDSESGGDGTISFKRVQSRVKPPPRRESLITLALQSTQNHGLTGRLGQVGPNYTCTDVQRARSPFSPMGSSPVESDDAQTRTRRRPSGAAGQSLNDVVHSPSSAQPVPLTSNGGDKPDEPDEPDEPDKPDKPEEPDEPDKPDELEEPDEPDEPVVSSPRTTRRKMIARELPEKLSRNLLWERKEKTLTANAVLKRRHTPKDLAAADRYPQRYHTTKDNSNNDSFSRDQDFTWETSDGYHMKGW